MMELQPLLGHTLLHILTAEKTVFHPSNATLAILYPTTKRMYSSKAHRKLVGLVLVTGRYLMKMSLIYTFTC